MWLKILLQFSFLVYEPSLSVNRGAYWNKQELGCSFKEKKRAKALGSEPTNFSPIPNYSDFAVTASYIYKDDGVEKEDDNSFRGI